MAGVDSQGDFTDVQIKDQMRGSVRRVGGKGPVPRPVEFASDSVRSDVPTIAEEALANTDPNRRVYVDDDGNRIEEINGKKRILPREPQL